eukprot:CAMPEP_0197592596 /NCGR_PEP_ID=MMETSP1326-20131121/15181_1 /TAXON_ID=1155430 /ORGANISM="Genus nov. species nov., Strain RCC2288" /LENGTH=45 /DNA_ID= /DNA_START= /DNA_END= /DNA_ORIENTATION=
MMSVLNVAVSGTSTFAPRSPAIRRSGIAARRSSAPVRTVSAAAIW